MKFPDLRLQNPLLGRGCFSTTNGAITEDIVFQYLEKPIEHPGDASR